MWFKKNIWKILLTLLVILSISFQTYNYFLQEKDKIELNKKLNAIMSSVSNIDDSINDLDWDIIDANDKINNLSGIIDDIQSTVSDIQMELW